MKEPQTNWQLIRTEIDELVAEWNGLLTDPQCDLLRHQIIQIVAEVRMSAANPTEPSRFIEPIAANP